MLPEAAFVIPGDLNTRTGGYIYQRRLLESLPEVGQPTRLVPVPTSWPYPTPEAAGDLATKLAALPEGMPLILDGLVHASMDTGLLAGLNRRSVAMLHHPAGLEAGLTPEVAQALVERETANLRHVSHVVVPSVHTRDILVSQFGVTAERISIAPPGFDRPAPLPPQHKATPPLILSVGIICARKGHDVLLDALARIAHLDWRAVIVGLTHDENVRLALLDQRTALGLDARVQFTGVIPPDALDTLYRTATLFALATRYEGYGMALSEAQLYGLPLVSCAVGAVPQTVPAGTGLLTAPDDPGAFADAIASVLIDADLRATLGAKSAGVGASLPTWQDTARVMRAALYPA